MKDFTINVGVRDEDVAKKFFVFDDPTTSNHIEISFNDVVTSNGNNGVQMACEFRSALILLSGLPTNHSYDFVLSGEAKALREQVYIISEDIYGDPFLPSGNDRK